MNAVHIAFALILSSSFAFAETEVVCDVATASSDDVPTKATPVNINNRVAALQKLGKQVEITLLTTSSTVGGAGAGAGNSERFDWQYRIASIDRICAALKW